MIIEFHCPICGTSIKRYPSRVPESGVCYCSNKCVATSNVIHGTKAEKDKAKYEANVRFRELNRSAYNERQRKWELNNPEKIKKAKSRSYFKNKDKNRAKVSDYCKKQSLNLTDTYIRASLYKQGGLLAHQLTQDVIEIKRVEMKLNRKFKENRNG